jgi:hypothetical protein
MDSSTVWSECRWVRKIPASDDSDRPARTYRLIAPRPQSIT